MKKMRSRGEMLKSRIKFTAFPREEAALRAVFSQITAEVRKKGIVLNEEDGSFYCSKRFGWKSTVKEFFDAYHKICERKQVPPIYQESKLTSALKVPYASIETVNLLHKGTVRRLLQFKEYLVPPFSKLPADPCRDDLVRIRGLAADDRDICRFIDIVVLIDEELREYVAQLDELAAAYSRRLSAFYMAVRDSAKEATIKKKYNDSQRTIERILAPYISKLKRIGALSSSWEYSFKRLPLTEEGMWMPGTAGVTEYWNDDILPLKSVREKEARRKEKERMEAERRRKREELKEQREARKAMRSAFELDLSGPTLWCRFDKWVSRVGDGIAYKIEDISDWMMRSWIWFLVVYLLLGIIVIWINEGFFTAVLSVLLLLFIIGVLSAILETVVAVISVIIKYITYIPLYIVRFIFYRGWTFLLAFLAACGGLVYWYLQLRMYF